MVAPAGLEPRGVEAIDRCAIFCLKSDMRPAACGIPFRVKPKRRCAARPEAARLVLDQAQRLERGAVEAHSSVEVLNFQSDVVVHHASLVLRASISIALCQLAPSSREISARQRN